jgi:hypothetical protein
VTKTLVFGSLPPPSTRASKWLLAAVLRERAEGSDVEIVSPTALSVAHRYLEFSGAAGCIEIGLAVRQCDRVIIQLARGFPVPPVTTRTRRAIELQALATALEQAPSEVVIRLPGLDDLAYGIGGRPAMRLWKRATRIEVPTPAMAEMFLRALSPVLGGDVGERIAVVQSEEPTHDDGSAARESTGGRADADLPEATRVVRARAAAVRERLATRQDTIEKARSVREGETESDDQTVMPLWQWIPVPRAGIPEWADSQAMHGFADQDPPLRRATRALLYAAESRELTRPLARGARLARRVAHRL